MKKSIACLLTIVWLLLAVGCKLPTMISGEESLPNSSEKSTSDSPENATVSALLEAIAARDSEAITALFAENAREEVSDFRDDVEELLNYMHEKNFQVEKIFVPTRGEKRDTASSCNRKKRWMVRSRRREIPTDLQCAM